MLRFRPLFTPAESCVYLMALTVTIARATNKARGTIIQRTSTLIASEDSWADGPPPFRRRSVMYSKAASARTNMLTPIQKRVGMTIERAQE